MHAPSARPPTPSCASARSAALKLERQLAALEAQTREIIGTRARRLQAQGRHRGRPEARWPTSPPSRPRPSSPRRRCRRLRPRLRPRKRWPREAEPRRRPAQDRGRDAGEAAEACGRQRPAARARRGQGGDRATSWRSPRRWAKISTRRPRPQRRCAGRCNAPPSPTRRCPRAPSRWRRKSQAPPSLPGASSRSAWSRARTARACKSI